MKKLAVVALGGNALLRGNQRGTAEEQEKNTFDTLENIVYMIKEGYDIILGHGNGPQVGNILMRNDAGENMYDIPQMPLDICVADSQGGIGYMIERMLRNVLKKHGIEKDIVVVVTSVEVDKNDPAFKDPQKRVGKIYTKEEADKLASEKGWDFKEEVKADGGWRRVVPSPKPISIMNEKTIEKLAREGNIVIAVGGGGVPVYIDEKGDVRPAEAVIDKDAASSLLGARIKADEFYILTDVPYVYLNYKKENEEVKEFLSVPDAEKYMEEGQFAKGSMAPKIQACIDFVKKGGKKSVITESTKLEDRSYGTKITAEYDK
ncbi:carbamate kinase [Salinivirga cyanobacteriivorans]|uniref:Carbamate kinase n=1 Tax=Salinivirga cyanobacteriivorans TaxID=1307839 RepID=A0A0S2HVD1_9BACT|nr:carbamate kinase [Salinivirga cyanobacteriivorans]ALO13957.1 Carbamate kinase 1 [Salinivirga cyanobacteriivorans]